MLAGLSGWRVCKNCCRCERVRTSTAFKLPIHDKIVSLITKWTRRIRPSAPGADTLQLDHVVVHRGQSQIRQPSCQLAYAHQPCNEDPGCEDHKQIEQFVRKAARHFGERL
jgi:hypothetical protein